MRSALALLALSIGLAASACVIVEDDPIVVDDNDSSLTIENVSDFALVEIRVTQVDNPSWGPDLTAGDVLFPGESMTVVLDCNTYDVLVVDEDDYSCELHDLSLCFEDAVWSITNGTLNDCGF